VGRGVRHGTHPTDRAALPHERVEQAPKPAAGVPVARRLGGRRRHSVRNVCCPDAPCSEERPCLHLAFFTRREATVLRARLIRASNASEPHRRREVLGVPHPSDRSGVGSRQHRWTTTQMSRQVASAVIGQASITVVGVRWGFSSEGHGADLRLVVSCSP